MDNPREAANTTLAPAWYTISVNQKFPFYGNFL